MWEGISAISTLCLTNFSQRFREINGFTILLHWILFSRIFSQVWIKLLFFHTVRFSAWWHFFRYLFSALWISTKINFLGFSKYLAVPRVEITEVYSHVAVLLAKFCESNVFSEALAVYCNWCQKYIQLYFLWFDFYKKSNHELPTLFY